MKTLIKESGIRNIKDLAKRYDKAKIYFHQDLDGVTTALGMKNYLEDNGIKVVDSEIIQYGDKEFAIKRLDAEGDTMPVLVDFAHGKPMFVIHTDHHDSQSGVEKDTATSFRPSRSNVATISQVMSPKDIFPDDDITLISTVDSADFARHGISPEQVMNFIFRVQKDKDLQQNKTALGLATNKLLLAFKNKPGFLEELVMTSQPSLMSIYQNIDRIAKRENIKYEEMFDAGLIKDRFGNPAKTKKFPYASPEEMTAHQKEYIAKQAESEKVRLEDGIIVQYGGGSMFKPGSYDRYTPFKNNPDADFLVIAWPMGLVQASCNPFKGERELKGVNLGEIAQEVLSKWESQLKDKIIPLSTIKWVSESGKQFDEESVGFTNKDLEAFYGDKVRSIDNGEQFMDRLKDIMNKQNNELTDEEWSILDRLGVPAWEMIQANSGGHKCITNISALNYFGRSKRPPTPGKKRQKKEGDSPSVKFIKMIQNRFVELLKDKINQSKNVQEIFEQVEGDDSVSKFIDELRDIDDVIKQSDSKNMSFKKKVETFQTALELLGYNLPVYGVDGKFGSETAESLNKFKSDNDIEIPDGSAIFDQQTKEKMVDLLDKKKISGEELKKFKLPYQEFSTLDGQIKHKFSGVEAKNIERLVEKMKELGVDDPITQIGMLAVIGKETNFVNKREKSYKNTPNNRIRKIFKRTRNLTDQELDNLKSDYNKFFNLVYNGRIGNDGKNDGSKYVGRGFNQLTGKGNYKKYGDIVGIDLVNNPEVLLQDDIAAEVAVKFLMSKGVPVFDDPNQATIYFADVNSGSPMRMARRNSLEQLRNFDIV
jgi:putative chitinase